MCSVCANAYSVHRYIHVAQSISTCETMTFGHHMLQAAIVSSREYQSWRESGVAFQLRDDAPYQHSNRTLASGLIIKQVVIHVHVCYMHMHNGYMCTCSSSTDLRTCVFCVCRVEREWPGEATGET